MKRLALIVRGHCRNEEELASDRVYINLYYSFLRSIAGGAWDEDEIVILEEPTFSELKTIIESSIPEYAMTILIGHGATQDGYQVFQLNTDTIIKPGQFTFAVPKQLIIVESCRSAVEGALFADLENKIATYRDGGYVRAHIDRGTSKKLYFDQINSCENGILICFACDLNQTANDYYFSFALLQFGQNLFLDTHYHYRTFDILDMMPVIKEEVQNYVSTIYGEAQTPVVKGESNYPFAVSKFDLLDFEKSRLGII